MCDRLPVGPAGLPTTTWLAQSGDLGDQFRIGGGLERLHPPGLDAVHTPHSVTVPFPPAITDTTTRHIEDNRRALQLPHLSDVTQARHRAWLAYNLTMYGQHGQDSAAANEAAAAAASTGDLESSILSGIALAYLDCANGYADRALDCVEELQALTPEGDMTAHHLAAIHLANLLGVVGRLDDAAALVAARTEKSQKEHDGMGLHIWALTAGVVQVAAGHS
jgi:hypothetical protein